MASDRLSPLQRLIDGLDFAAAAWREAWGAQALAALGLAMMATAWLARGLGGGSELFAIGAVVSAVAWSPLFGALYQIELVRPERRDLGLYGLQIGPLEWRLLGLLLCFAGAALLAALLMVAALAAVFVVFQGEGEVDLWPFGPVRTAFVAAAGVVTLGLAGCLWGWLRLSLSPVLTASSGRLAWLESWDRTAGRAMELLTARLCSLAPSLMLVLLAALMDRLETGGASIWRGAGWPLFDAAVFGLLAGGVLAFVQAPALVAVLSGFQASLGNKSRIQAVRASQNRRAPEPFPS
jgi:hypothetical protein